MNKENQETGFEIAVIGIAARYPGARDAGEFWDNLICGRETIAFFSEKELQEAGIPEDQFKNPNFVKAWGAIEGAEYFDANFFGYTYKEAELMAPQLRLFHECAWASLEDAGYWPGNYKGVIGLYAGSNIGFQWEALSMLSGKAAEYGGFSSIQLTNKDFLCSRTAYKLNLTGPTLSVHTACSTSLVAIHLASQALINGECDIALAGGVCVAAADNKGYIYQEGMTFSPDGHCRTFDARAKGMLAGEGVGVIVLERLSDALHQQDHIYALIKGSAINNDGMRRVGFTAPSIEGQAEVIKAAQQMAGVEPETIGYIENHGTATELGDPVEIEALKLVFNTKKKHFCALGSVKSNFGHLDSAAGSAGFIKAVLALKHRLIPPNLHFESPSPKIDLEDSSFYVNTRLQQWERKEYPRRAGVSSFGIGGTNAHIVLEEWIRSSPGREIPPQEPHRDYQLLLLSAAVPSALEQMTANLADFFKNHPNTNLADAAYTLQLGRKPCKHRRKWVCANTTAAIDSLTSASPREKQFSTSREGKKTVVFMFPGLGPQYVNMGRDLYEKEPLFRREMDHCFEILKSLMGYDIKEILYPPAGSYPGNPDTSLDIHDFEIAQPLIFILEYALARLLMDWGIKPQAMIGYSIGEYTAACLSGVFSLEDALEIIVTRGQLVRKIPPGTMLSVPQPVEQVKPLLEDFNSRHQEKFPGVQQLSIGIDNGPSCIVSGPTSAAAALEEELNRQKLLCMNLKGSHAIHSAMMEPIAAEFTQFLAQITFQQPQIPYISNVTGTWITFEQALDPGYWSNHLQQTVQFARGIRRIQEQENVIWLEVGPDRSLCTLLSNFIDLQADYLPVNLVRHPQHQVSDLYYLLSKIGQLWLYGIDMDWQAFYPQQTGKRISLPTYPFERQRYWLDRQPLSAPNPAQVKPAGTSEPQKTDLAAWFYYPSWVRTCLNPISSKEREKNYQWLVFQESNTFCRLLIKRLKEKGHHVVTVTQGKENQPVNNEVNPASYFLDPENEDAYHRLFNELKKQGQFPQRIVHCWSITEPTQTPAESGVHPGDILPALARGYYSIINLAKALGKQNITEDIEIGVVSDHLYQVTGQEDIHPQKATLLGPLKVIPQEYSFIRCRCVDIQLPGPGTPGEEQLVNQLTAEFTHPGTETVIALRDNYRWTQTFQPIRFHQEETIPRIKEQGVYLITGGLGRVGLTLARYLLESAGARVILIGRDPLPPRDQWHQHLAAEEVQDPQAVKIRQMQELEKIGHPVLYFAADVSDHQRMQEVIAAAEEQLGPLDGFIHAAGETGDSVMRPIEYLQPADSQKQFQAKIYGLLNLVGLLEKKPLDFCWLTSSLSPILGGLGLSAYAAANHFMDAFVHYCHRQNQRQWISVNWADWDFDEGMDNMGNDRQNIPGMEITADQRQWGMKPHEGVETFRRILFHSREPQVVISTVNLQTRIDQWVKLESLHRDQTLVQSLPAHAYKTRPQLESPFIKPSSQLEQALAKVIQDFLGIEEVGIQDNFYELGATSLNIIQINNTVREKLKLDISLMRWFEYPTIKSLTAYLRKTGMEIDPTQPPIDRTDIIDKGINKLIQIQRRTVNRS